MSLHNDLKCWEIINCDHLDCPARNEPETPCWEIAKRVGAFIDVSNTCRDCIVCIIKKTTPVITSKELQNFLKQKRHYERVGKEYPACTLRQT